MTRDASSGTPGNQQMLHIVAAGNHGSSTGSIAVDEDAACGADLMVQQTVTITGGGWR